MIAQPYRQHRHQEFLRFLKLIDGAVPRDLDLHLICDNYATCKTPEVKRWLLRHPRLQLHFTPTSASWLNLTRRWFAELTNRKLRRSAHRSVTELEADLRHWTNAWNKNPKPDPATGNVRNGTRPKTVLTESTGQMQIDVPRDRAGTSGPQIVRKRQLNDLFAAWADYVANRRMHAETGQAPIERFQAGGPCRQADPALLREGFRWSVTRRVTRTATIPLEGNSYAVDPSLTGRRVELRCDPEDLSRIDVWLDGKPVGVATPFVTRRHVHRAVPQAARPEPAATGIDYLGLVAAAHDGEAGTAPRSTSPPVTVCAPCPGTAPELLADDKAAAGSQDGCHASGTGGDPRPGGHKCRILHSGTTVSHAREA